MTYKRQVTHSEEWWAKAPPHVLRCTAHYKSTGGLCRREAAIGAPVCNSHGALTPAVRAKAATRIQMSVDDAARQLVAWLNDDNVDMRERIKIAHDLLDRGGLAATSKVLVGIAEVDPVEQLFASLLARPDALAAPVVDQVKVIEPDSRQARLDAGLDPLTGEDLIGCRNGTSHAEDVVDAELVEDKPPARPSVSPPKRIRDGFELLGLL